MDDTTGDGAGGGGTVFPTVPFAGCTPFEALRQIAGAVRVMARCEAVALVVPDRQGCLSWALAGTGEATRAPSPHVVAIGLPTLQDGVLREAGTLLAVPLSVGHRVVAAAVLLGTPSQPAADAASAVALVGLWAVAIDNLVALDAAEQRAANLERALRHRAVIEQAKGILMQRERCTSEQAFGLLRERSQLEHQKVVTVAAELVADVALEHAVTV